MQLRMATLQLLKDSRPGMTSEKALSIYSRSTTGSAQESQGCVVKCSVYKTQLLNLQSILKTGKFNHFTTHLKPGLRYNAACTNSLHIKQRGKWRYTIMYGHVKGPQGNMSNTALIQYCVRILQHCGPLKNFQEPKHRSQHL